MERNLPFGIIVHLARMVREANRKQQTAGIKYGR